MLTLKDIRENEEVKIYVEAQDAPLAELGYTEHSFPHVIRVAEGAADVLISLGFSERDAELARIAGYLHDIGNLVNRQEHSQSGALIAFRLLDKLGMDPREITKVVSAIGNHDEGTGVPVNEIAAALILADKADVRRSRVRNDDPAFFDIHDRVNYSVTASDLSVSEDRTVTLSLTVDTTISKVMDYFEIFLERMILCKKAADRLLATFKLRINGQDLL